MWIFHKSRAVPFRKAATLTLAMVVTVFFTWCADFLVLRHFGWVYLRTLVFSLIALLTVFLLRKAARLWPELSHRIDADLASVSTNCAVPSAATPCPRPSPSPCAAAWASWWS